MNTLNGQTQPPDTERVFAYFLGELPAVESDRFEEEVFEDESLAEQVFALEEELIELYLHDGLTPARRTRFEQHYLTTAERRTRVEFAAALEAELSPPPAISQDAPATRTVWWQAFLSGLRPAWALLLLLGVTTGLWWMLRNRAPSPDEIARNATPTPQPTASAVATAAPTVTPSPAPPRVTPTVPLRPGVIVALTLSPGLTLGGGQQLPTLQLPAGAEAAELKLLLHRADFASYRVVLQTGGATIWTNRGLKAQPTANGTAELSVRVPARRLKRADYLLQLFGEGQSAPVASYSFSVRTD